MIVYRIARDPFAEDLTGEGAKLFGGRWNYPGTACLYTATSRSLAILEFRSHLSSLSQLPDKLKLLRLQVPDKPVHTVDAASLPEDWRSYPAPASCMLIGEQLLQRREHLLIKVPSVIVPEEFNVLINPRHTNARKLKLLDCLPLLLDPRLFQ